MFDAPRMSFLRLSTLLTFLLSWSWCLACSLGAGLTQYTDILPPGAGAWSLLVTFFFHPTPGIPGGLPANITHIVQFPNSQTWSHDSYVYTITWVRSDIACSSYQDEKVSRLSSLSAINVYLDLSSNKVCTIKPSKIASKRYVDALLLLNNLIESCHLKLILVSYDDQKKGAWLW